MQTALAIMDYYIDHYTELGHQDTVRKFKEARTDMVNAEIAQQNNEYIRLIRKLGSERKPVLACVMNEEYNSFFERTDIGEVYEIWDIYPVYNKGDNTVYQRGYLESVWGVEGIVDEVNFIFYGEAQSGYTSKEDVESILKGVTP